MVVDKIISKTRKYFFTFTNKLMLLFLILMLLSNFIIGVYSYTVLANFKNNYVKENIARLLQQTKDNVEIQIGDVQRISNQLFNDYSLQKLFKSKEDAYTIYDLTRLYLSPVLKSYTSLSLKPISINIYTQNENMSESYTPTEEFAADERNYNIYKASRIYSKPWYKDIVKEGRDNIWRQVESDKEYGNISLLRKFISFDNFEQIGYLRIVVRMKDLFKSVNSYRGGDYSRLYLIDNKSNIILYSSNGDSLGKKFNSKAKGYFVSLEKLSNGNWSLAAQVSEAVLHAEAEKIRNMTILICFSIFIFVAALGILISKKLTKKVKKIVSSIRNFRDGKLTKRIEYKGEDEFGYISTAFNEMADNIQELIEEVYITEINKREAELEALQAQINPHFLYNTLSSISSLANMGEIDSVNEMVAGLVKFYRLTLNKGKAILTVGEELEQVKAYIDIQAIKYGNRFQISYKVDEKALKYKTLKLILQPFVENVLNHAWYEEVINIRVTAEMTGEDIIFRIIDDGIGMPKETIGQIFRTDGTNIGYGIRNVNDRIKLQYGEEYGVSISSEVGKGTIVKIVIPQVA